MRVQTSLHRIFALIIRVSLIPGLCAILLGQGTRRINKMESSVHRAESRDDWQGRFTADAIRSMRQPARRVFLGRLSAAESQAVPRKPGLSVVGVSRRLPDDVLSQGEWGNSPEGKRVWRLTLQSAGADALRVHFSDFHLGSGKLWLLGVGTDSATAGPYTGDGLFGDGEFWTDMVAGESLIIAYEPAEPAADTTPFHPVEISHRLPIRAEKSSVAGAGDVTTVPLAAAASCSLDVSCYPQYSDAASAVALMIFESAGATYQCTGSLISSDSSPALPFFLTANHCISNQTEARSLISIFKYQTPGCSGDVPSLSSLPRVTGASFVAGQPMAAGDFSLLQLTGFPNVDVKVLGWSAEPIASDEQVIGISHPRGDYKRIAFGQRTRDVTIRFSDGERMPANVGYQVSWSEGVHKTVPRARLCSSTSMANHTWSARYPEDQTSMKTIPHRCVA
jgi:lysyl endopeptidase